MSSRIRRIRLSRRKDYRTMNLVLGVSRPCAFGGAFYGSGGSLLCPEEIHDELIIRPI